MFVFQKFLVVNRSAGPGPALIMLISSTHKASDFFVDPWYNIS